MRVINYETGESILEIEDPTKDIYVQAMVSLNEVLRQDPSRPL